MANLDHFKAANEASVAGFKDGGKPMPPARKALVITCMDGEGEGTVPPDLAAHRWPVMQGHLGLVQQAAQPRSPDTLGWVTNRCGLASLFDILCDAANGRPGLAQEPVGQLAALATSPRDHRATSHATSELS